MASIADSVFDDGLDAGLAAIATATNLDLHICSQEPTTYAEATSTYTLGDQQDVSITGPTDGDVSGRKVTVGAVTAGDVTGTGTATHVALVDTNSSALLITQALSSSQAVTSGNTFSLNAWDIEIPDPS